MKTGIALGASGSGCFKTKQRKLYALQFRWNVLDPRAREALFLRGAEGWALHLPLHFYLNTPGNFVRQLPTLCWFINLNWKTFYLALRERRDACLWFRFVFHLQIRI